MDAHRREPERPGQWADEIQALPSASHGLYLRHTLGIERCQSGQAPYFWGLISDPSQRADMLKDGWKGVGKVFILALVLDIVYQVIVQRFVYPGEAIIVAFVLAILPYLILRGLVTRLAQKK
jgi:hypothetical protein